jgi:hypothetical protein
MLRDGFGICWLRWGSGYAREEMYGLVYGVWREYFEMPKPRAGTVRVRLGCRDRDVADWITGSRFGFGSNWLFDNFLEAKFSARMIVALFYENA